MREGFPRIEKEWPDSGERLDYVEITRKLLTDDANIFGSNVDAIRRSAQGIGDSPELKKMLQSAISKLKFQLRHFAATSGVGHERLSKSAKVASDFFLRAFTEDEGLRKRAERQMGIEAKQTPLEDLAGFTLREFVAGYFLPSDKMFAQMIGAHVRYAEARAAEFRKNLPEMLRDARAAIEDGIQRGVLPISKAAVERRWKTLKVIPQDALLSGLEDNLGKFDADTLCISIGMHLQKEDQKKVLVHEILHALSGRMVLKTTDEPDDAFVPHQEMLDEFEDYGDPSVHFSQERTGLAFAARGIGDSRFRWLNEAVTQRLTESVMPGRVSFTGYADEMELLACLSSEGKVPVEEQLFTKAYFENYDRSNLRKKPMTAWRALQHALQNAYGPRFLVRLDEFIRKNDVKKAVAAIKGHDASVMGAEKPKT